MEIVVFAVGGHLQVDHVAINRRLSKHLASIFAYLVDRYAMDIAVKATVEEILMGLVFHHKQSGTLRFILGGENHACGTLIFMMLHTAAYKRKLFFLGR